jgi:hypothetical protein
MQYGVVRHTMDGSWKTTGTVWQLSKVFNTKEEAEQWIEKQYLPYQYETVVITTCLTKSELPITVTF